MTLLSLGINHKTAPVAIRERLSFAPHSLDAALKTLQQSPGVASAVIISTCNRTEIYCETDSAETLYSWLLDAKNIDIEEFTSHLYLLRDEEAIRHLFRVACGLDSMVLGEAEILGQVKKSYRAAVAAGTLGKNLEKLFQHSFFVAKRVRAGTGIGAGSVSVVVVALRLAECIFSSLNSATALLIGGGETIHLVARHLSANNIGSIIVANRCPKTAVAVATSCGGKGIGLTELGDYFSDADIVVCATASSVPIVGKGCVESALLKRKRKPILILDLAVPRDVEAEVGTLADIYLYTIDDLQKTLKKNKEGRLVAAASAEEIVCHESGQYLAWLRSQKAQSLIADIRHQSHCLAKKSLSRALQQLDGGAEPAEVLERLATSLTNELLHTPSVQLRAAGEKGREEIVASARELFGLP